VVFGNEPIVALINKEQNRMDYLLHIQVWKYKVVFLELLQENLTGYASGVQYRKE
jgi:hypothetical protein